MDFTSKASIPDDFATAIKEEILNSGPGIIAQ